MWPLAVLTGDRINGFFFKSEKVWRGRLAGPKKSGRNNEVAEGGVPPYIGPLILKAIVM